MSRYDQSEKDIMDSWNPSPQQERFQAFVKSDPADPSDGPAPAEIPEGGLVPGVPRPVERGTPPMVTTGMGPMFDRNVQAYCRHVRDTLGIPDSVTDEKVLAFAPYREDWNHGLEPGDVPAAVGTGPNAPVTVPDRDPVAQDPERKSGSFREMYEADRGAALSGARFQQFLKAGFDWETGDQFAQRARARGDADNDRYFSAIGDEAVEEGGGNIGAAVTYEANGTIADEQQKAVAQDIEDNKGLEQLFLDDPREQAKAIAAYNKERGIDVMMPETDNGAFPTGVFRDQKLALSKPNGMPAGYHKSEGAMAAGGSNATASDSGAFNARYSSKRFADFADTPLGSPRDFSEREHQEAPDRPGAPDVHAD